MTKGSTVVDLQDYSKAWVSFHDHLLNVECELDINSLELGKSVQGLHTHISKEFLKVGFQMIGSEI